MDKTSWTYCKYIDIHLGMSYNCTLQNHTGKQVQSGKLGIRN